MHIRRFAVKPAILAVSLCVLLYSCQKASEPPPAPSGGGGGETGLTGAPTITAMSPATGDGGTIVTLTGTNFDTTMSGDTVMVNAVPAVIKSATATSITFVVPQNAMSGAVRVATSKGYAVGPGFKFPVNVYATGYQRTTANGNSLVMTWKNGYPTQIGPDYGYGEGTGLAVSDTNVYVSGWQFNSGGNPWAKYWVNGVEHRLFEGPSDGYAYGIAVSGQNVYVAGVESADLDTNQKRLVKYWKNDVATDLSPVIPGDCAANGIAVSGNNVYTVGYMWVYPSGISAMYWKNGTATTITPQYQYSYCSASSIFVSGSDVYIGWNEQSNIISTAKIWKNGVSTSLTDGSRDATVQSVFVVGNDVYAAGYESNGARKVAKYWKNGAPVVLSDGTTDAEASSIAVVGKDIYVGGYVSVSGYALIDGSDSGCIATIWKNGTPYYLNKPIYPGKVEGIVVK